MSSQNRKELCCAGVSGHAVVEEILASGEVNSWLSESLLILMSQVLSEWVQTHVLEKCGMERMLGGTSRGE